MLEQKLLEEIERYRSINKYTSKLMNEQDVPPPPGGDVPPPPGDVPPPPGGDVPPPPGGEAPPPSGGESETEEVDITDLVNMQKSIKKDIEDNKNDHNSVLNKMDDVFTKLNDLESKLSQMDQLFNKIEQLGSKVDSMKEKTPQEKLELRSLDSYPFNQNPQQFFAKKQGDMQMSGKNEYILKKSDIENYSSDEIRNSFNSDNQDEFRY